MAGLAACSALAMVKLLWGLSCAKPSSWSTMQFKWLL